MRAWGYTSNNRHLQRCNTSGNDDGLFNPKNVVFSENTFSGLAHDMILFRQIKAAAALTMANLPLYLLSRRKGEPHIRGEREKCFI
jgi:hypothetical protein